MSFGDIGELLLSEYKFYTCVANISCFCCLNSRNDVLKRAEEKDLFLIPAAPSPFCLQLQFEG